MWHVRDGTNAHQRHPFQSIAYAPFAGCHCPDLLAGDRVFLMGDDACILKGSSRPPVAYYYLVFYQTTDLQSAILALPKNLKLQHPEHQKQNLKKKKNQEFN